MKKFQKVLLGLGLISSSLYAGVDLRDTTWTYKEYYIPLNEDGWYAGGGYEDFEEFPGPGYLGGNENTSDSIVIINDDDAKVIENEFLKIVVSPNYGGRVMSIYHKPTETEQLYHANVAAPYPAYSGGEATFYYNHLTVQGGILPTFPDPEHGRTWNKPWDIKVIEDSAEEAFVEISYLDDVDGPGYAFNGGKWAHGPNTMLQCVVKIGLKKGEASMYYDVTFSNEGTESKIYEYWTLTTLTPGTDPEYTISPVNTLILSPNEKVRAQTIWWDWMANVDQGSGDVYDYMNFAKYENWVEEGILYANPQMEKDWWGAINLDNNHGILRISDHNKTPGMKYWTWGETAFDNGQPRDPSEKTERKTHIELWGGHSKEFFQTETIEPGVAINWVENFYPTFGLDTVNYANPYGALQVKDDELIFSATFPNQEHTFTLNGEEVKAIAPDDKPIILDINNGCLDSDIEIELDGETVVTYDASELGRSGGSCEVSVIQQGEIVEPSSSSEDESSSSDDNNDSSSSDDNNDSSSSEDDNNDSSSSEDDNDSSSSDDLTPVLDAVDAKIILTSNMIFNPFEYVVDAKIYDIRGRMIKAMTLVPGENIIDVNSIAPLYVQVFDGHKEYFVK